jgi:chromosome segregation ATPase
LLLEKLTKEAKNRQTQLEQEVTETRASQIELDKAEEEFKSVHRERTELLNQLDDALSAIRARDAAITQAQDNIIRVQQEADEKKNVIAEKKKFLDTEKDNNVEVEKKITMADRQVTKLRVDYGSAQQSVTGIQDDLETIKNTLAKDNSTLEAKKTEIQLCRREIEMKLKRKEKSKAHLEKTKQNLELHFQQTDDLETRAKQVLYIFITGNIN